jgi:ABC-2 type transport system ATP-binding protein
MSLFIYPPMTDVTTAHGGTALPWDPIQMVTFYGNVRAVDGLTLDLRHGETVAFLGPNGAGKPVTGF